MTQRTDGNRPHSEHEAEREVMERAGEVLDGGLTDDRAYVVLVFDRKKPETRKNHNACITTADFHATSVAMLATARKFFAMADSKNLDEVHDDDT